jgi:hypothetical protein
MFMKSISVRRARNGLGVIVIYEDKCILGSYRSHLKNSSFPNVLDRNLRPKRGCQIKEAKSQDLTVSR